MFTWIRVVVAFKAIAGKSSGAEFDGETFRHQSRKLSSPCQAATQ